MFNRFLGAKAKSKTCSRILSATLLASCVAPYALAVDPPREPRLVVLIVVDQMRCDYLTRWSDHFEGGFKQLLQNGAFFPNAYVTYGASETAPGHATIGTGCLPRQHGIVGNKWFLAPGVTKPQLPVEDPNVQLIGAETPERGGPSPVALLTSTLGDQMKLADRRSRVYSIALKDRAAIFMAGRSADGVYWCDKPTGRIVTSTFYATTGSAQLPEYIEKCNAAGGMWQYAGHTWETLLPADAYAGTQSVEADWSEVYPKVGTAFPHTLPAPPKKHTSAYSELMIGTSFGNELTLRLAREIVEVEKLGRGPAPDLLCISLSANDYVGHFFGPESAEVLDITVRTDRQLGEFFTALDKEVGAEHYIVALTADHGMSPSPHTVQRLRLPGDVLDTAALCEKAEHACRDALGSDAPQSPLVLGINAPWVYCDPQFDELDSRLAGKLTQTVAKVLRAQEGVAAVFTAADLAGPAPLPDDRERWLAWRCYAPRRAGHFYIALAPGWTIKDPDDIAAHAAGFRCDRHVPILLSGPGVRAGWYYAPADLADIAPSLAALLGIEPPAQAVGRVLGEAMVVSADAPARHKSKEKSASQPAAHRNSQ